jgi:hypothetical protein
MNFESYCLSCKMEMVSVVEAAKHLIGGCIVESHPKGERA